MAGLLITYFLALGTLACFGLHRLLLVQHAWRARRLPRATAGNPNQWPAVLVQLPVYNEAFVVERLVVAAAALEYEGPLEIQVLDDSNDETCAVLNQVVQRLHRPERPIRLVRRPDRTGFKAGALAYGLAESSAPLVAIFDADFIPPPDFLVRVVPEILADPKCGMVQARWSHLNRRVNRLTRAQALFLDGHFGVEHLARASAGLAFNFNGTAGLWRREAIDGAGGWSSDTITEDLDLSYRAQLAGYSFRYLDQVRVPAELPEDYTGFRSQQSRWVRGSIQTLRKQWKKLLFADRWPLRKRLEALLHMASNCTYVPMAFIALVLPATVVLRDRYGWMVPGGEWVLTLLDVSMLTAGTMAMLVFYAYAVRSAPPDPAGRLVELPFALCLGAGLSISNAIEVCRGWFSAGTEFVRTPKRGGAQRARMLRLYRAPKANGRAWLEMAFALYHGLAVAYAALNGLWGSIPFLLLFSVGFTSLGSAALFESFRIARLAASEDVGSASSAGAR